MQDSGFGTRSSPEFDTLPVRQLVVLLSKALHAALLLSTQEQMGTFEGRFVSRGPKLRVSGCILPRELRWISKWIWTVKAQWPGKVLVKVCRAELWAWMWTQNSDFTFTLNGKWLLLQVNPLRTGDSYMFPSPLRQVMACIPIGMIPLPGPNSVCRLDNLEQME